MGVFRGLVLGIHAGIFSLNIYRPISSITIATALAQLKKKRPHKKITWCTMLKGYTWAAIRPHTEVEASDSGHNPQAITKRASTS